MLDQDVQSRVDAYRGNPQALQQKYSVSKDLLDLMALQKLTKEKESAARELQMAMAAQQGQGAGTIRDQLQQKALGMTKQELEKQQMALLQQKQQQQQQNLQQLAQSGIAQNPAPNMEGGPGFASGGIIAFAGPTGSEVPKPAFSDPYSDVNVARDKLRKGEPLTEREEKLLISMERKLEPAPVQINPVMTPRISMSDAQAVLGNPGPDPKLMEERLKAENLELNRGTRTAYSPDVQAYSSQQRANDVAASNAKQRQVPAYMQDAVRATNQGAFPTPAPIAPAAQAEAPINVSSGASGFPMTAAPGIPSALPERREQPAERKVPEKVRAVRPAPVPPVGIATPQAAPAAPQATPQAAPTAPQAAPAAPQAAAPVVEQSRPNVSEFAEMLKSRLEESAENPSASRQGILQQFLTQHGLTPQERSDRTKYQEALRARHASLSDPEDLRREKLKQTLLGMAGASNAGIALARGAAAGQNYEAGRNAEGLKTLEQLQGINEGETAARRKALETGYGLGGREAESVRSAETARYNAATGAIANVMGYESSEKRLSLELKQREKEVADKIAADERGRNLDNASRERIGAAANKTNIEVHNIAGRFQVEAARLAREGASASALASLIQTSNDRINTALIASETRIREDASKRKSKLEAGLAIATPQAAAGIKQQLDVVDAEAELAIRLVRESAYKSMSVTGLDKVGVTGSKPSADGFGDMTVRPSK